MRITIDRNSDTVHLALVGGGGAQTRELTEGISVQYDAQGRLVGVTIHGIGRLSGTQDAPVTIDLAGDHATGASGVPVGASPEARASAVAPGPSTIPPPRPPTPRPAAAPAHPAPPHVSAAPAARGPLTWDPEAEAAMARVPFFQRGAQRLAVVHMARSRGLNVVTAALVEEARGR